MFSKIYLQEVRYWFKLPLFYIYTGIMFALAVLVMAMATGVFDSNTVTVTSAVNVNSPLAILGQISLYATLTYLLIPSLVGGTIQRDFSNNMHHVLYSYPLTKASYILAKFTAGITVTLLVIIAGMLGIIIGGYLPGANEALLGPFEIRNYVEPFLYFVIPNVVFYGALVFALTAFFRNINLGFIVILVLIIAQTVMSSYVAQADDPYIYLLIDPTGQEAIGEMVQYWTVEEQNTRNIPFEGALLTNRLIWGTVGLTVFLLVLWRFRFNQHATSITLGRKKKSARSTKRNFGVIQQIQLPKVATDFGFLANLKAAWRLSRSDIKYIVTGWPFIIIAVLGFAFSLLTMQVSGQIYGTSILPKTWLMLDVASSLFIVFSFVLIYLYGGLIMDRARAAHMAQLVDASPVANWVMVLAKVIALSVMMFTLLVIVILSGMFIQTFNGFTEYQLDVYLFDLYMIQFWDIFPWILMTIFIHTLVKNKWLGIAILLVIAVAVPMVLSSIGMEQEQFIYNQGGPSPSFSDMNHYGTALPEFYLYRIYWIGLGIFLFVLSVIFYRRGMSQPVAERFAFAKARLTKPLAATAITGLIAFVGLGSWFWYTNNMIEEQKSGKEYEMLRVNYEKDLRKYIDAPQPRITAVNVHLDIFPETRDYKAKGEFTLVNRTDAVIDTLHLNLRDSPTTFTFSRKAEKVYDSDDYNYRMYSLEPPLQPGDTIQMNFQMQNKENSLLVTRSPIIQNGTFLNSGMFPSIGYSEQGELRNTQLREKYDLPPRPRMPAPDEPGATDDNYIGGSSDWIDFEATVSTSGDQTAIAPGYLIKKWTEDGRNYFHYKMDSKMVNFYAFLSGEYDVKRDQHNGVSLEIFHHPDHTYNLDRMMNSLKQSLDYYGDAFTAYQHRQARIIEFPKRYGTFAQSFANTIPFSEGIGFIADVDDEDPDAVDYPFSVTAHELAHQWWAHQVIGANAQGSTLLSESLSEYSSLMVLQETYGKGQMRKFLKEALDSYLSGRSGEQIGERPLMYNENQQYIHYNKGSLVLYALSDFWGEENLNNVIKDFAEKYQFAGPPYPTGPDFVEMIDEKVPDSLAYLVDDMFKTITLYDNRAEEATYTKEGDEYKVEFKALVSKYRSTPKGEAIYRGEKGDSLTYDRGEDKKPLKSVPLNDYVEVGVFGKMDDEKGVREVLYLKKHKITEIENNFQITVDQEPEEVGVDPFNVLIDRKSRDNRISVSKK